MTADHTRCGGLRVVLNTRDMASEHMQRSDISVDGAGLAVHCGVHQCMIINWLPRLPDVSKSQTNRQNPPVLHRQYFLWGEKRGYFQRKHGCLVTLLWMASVWKAASGAGKVNQPLQNASKSELNLKKGEVITGKERSLWTCRNVKLGKAISKMERQNVYNNLMHTNTSRTEKDCLVCYGSYYWLQWEKNEEMKNSGTFPWVLT